MYCDLHQGLQVVLRILLGFLGLADGLAGAPKMPL
jgi:hypothetical protein